MMISIIIPTHNRKDNIIKLLQCLSKQIMEENRNFEVILVDHASVDGTEDAVKYNDYPFDFTYLPIKERTKWSASIPRNFGAKHIQKESIGFLFLDSDVLLPPNRINRLFIDIEQNSNPNRVIIGPYHFMNQQVDTTNSDWYKSIHNYAQDVRWKSFEAHPVDQMNIGWPFALACFGGYLFVPKDLFFKAGMYDEKCVAGVEDGDFGLTLWESGATFSLDKELLGWHNPHEITPERTENLSEMIKYLNLKHGMDLVYQTGKVYREWDITWEVPNSWKEEL